MPAAGANVNGRVTGLWVYQALGTPPDPEVLVARAKRFGLRWVTAQAIKSGELLDRDWCARCARPPGATTCASVSTAAWDSRSGRDSRDRSRPTKPG